jgi:hypothetical protein
MERWEVEGIKPYTIGIKMEDGRKEYISFDWASPAVAPFFMGATMEQNFKQKGVSLSSFADAGIAGLDVLWQMSFVQGLNNILGGYGSPTTKITDVLMQLPFQAFPQWLAKINMVIDDNVRQYPNSSDIFLATRNNLLRRLPGGTFNLEPKLDAWGNNLKQGQINPKLGWFGRFFNAYVAPYKVYNGTVGEATEEVVRIYRAARDAGESGAAGVLPDFSDVSLPESPNGPKTDAENTELNRIAGQYAQKAILQEMKLPDYSESGGSKYDAINRIYTEARAEAKRQVQESRGEESSSTTSKPKLTVSVNGKKKEYTLSETKYQEYNSLVAEYKDAGYSNAEAAARSKILNDMGYKVPIVNPKKTYAKPTEEAEKIDTTGG